MEGDTELGDIFAHYNALTNEETPNNGSNVEIVDEPNPLSDKEAESRFISWYEEICKERMAMLETEEKHKNKIKELEETEERYRNRIKELDENSIALLQAFEQTQLETKLLRKKYEPTGDGNGDNGFHEPYSDIAKDRDRLINAEKKYKQRIENLEAEVATLRNYVKDFESLPQLKNTPKQKRNKVKSEKLIVITGEEYIAKVEKENASLRDKLDRFERGIVPCEVSKKEITKTENKSIKSVQTDRSVKREEAKSVISKKYSPPFFPKIPSASSGSLDDDQSTSVTLLNRTTQTPRLTFGLGYHQIYSKKELKRTDCEYKSTSKK